MNFMSGTLKMAERFGPLMSSTITTVKAIVLMLIFQC